MSSPEEPELVRTWTRFILRELRHKFLEPLLEIKQPIRAQMQREGRLTESIATRRRCVSIEGGSEYRVPHIG